MAGCDGNWDIMKTGPRVPLFHTIAAAFFALVLSAHAASALTVDHTCATLSAIPESAIAAAKTKLKIVYGHTSHGSQLTTGMDGLASWKGSLYAWNGSGDGGALRLVDYYGNFGGYGTAQDLGNPDFTSWESATRTYLAAHTDTNVVVWSWCGELAWASEADAASYLSLMSGLEADFPAVTFVYMTCHLDGTGEAGNLNLRNEQIRSYCKNHNKALYDFADIESYDPDGLVNYMKKYANDACDYDSNGDTYTDTNWATAWQNAHTVNVDWYNCEAAHSQPLNANRKAYAAWYLWARLGGWNGSSTVADTAAPTVPATLSATVETASSVALSWTASTDNTAVTGYKVYRDGTQIAVTVQASYADAGLNPSTTYSYAVSAYDAVGNESARCAAVGAKTKYALSWADVEEPGDTVWYNTWYGWFYYADNYGFWIYSCAQGFQGIWPTSTPENTYVWDDALQHWWWTGKGFFPYIYDYTSETWLCYVDGLCPNRSFWDYTQGRRVSESAL
jgi:hypothetical protein